MNNQTKILPLSPAAAAYQKGRSNFLLAVGFTAINIVLLVFGAPVYMLFSAAVPYNTIWFGMYLTDRLPQENYLDEAGNVITMGWPDALFYGAIAAAVVMLLGYLLLWWLSGKHPIFAAIGAALFAIDTVVMVFLNLVVFQFDVSVLLDFAFHIYVFVTLILCCINGFKARKEPVVVLDAADATVPEEVVMDAPEAAEPTVEPVAEETASEQPTKTEE